MSTATSSTEKKKSSLGTREYGQHVSKARFARLVGNTTAPAPSTDFTKVASNVLQAVQAKRSASGAKPNLSLQFMSDKSGEANAKGNSGSSASVFKQIHTSRNPASASDSNRLINAVMAMDKVHMGKKDEVETTKDDHGDDEASPTGETLPLIGSQAGNGPGAAAQIMSKAFGGTKSYGSTGSTSAAPHRRNAKTIYMLKHVGHAIVFFFTLLLRSYAVMLGLPLLILAGVLFYILESGVLEIDFLPGNATLCWWLIFGARQCVTLDIARIIQWFLVDFIALSSKIGVQLFGPFLILVAIQARGWPFLATWWSLLDLTLLYGDNRFQQNWFYALKQAIFDEDESGGNAILMSEIYLRILLSVLVASVVTTIKRTSLAMYFGRKTVVHYRHGLEALLADIEVIAEVAQLADEARKIDETTEGDGAPAFDAMTIRKGLYDTKWHTMTGFGASAQDSQQTHEFVYDESEAIEGVADADVVDKDSDLIGDQQNAPKIAPTSVTLPAAGGTQIASNDFSVKDLLDVCDEPVNKLDKTDVSINDILQFQKALTYMDEKFPFSEEFGPATSRDECVKSAQDVYRRLLKLSSRSGVLAFEILKLLSLNENGVEDEAKTNTVKRVFRPDKSDELPLLAFVQSCDAVYKRLRFFRASVRNSSVIDEVLQNIIDACFYFALALLMLSMLNFDPWPLLASVSTLLISFSFAFGNSTARIVDGILLIAAQRPFDLGDRIVINAAEDVVNYGVDYSWYVEDINLFTTTLRFAKTNEVATVSNGTIIQSRIVNCQRSQHALVTLHLEFRIDATEDDLEDFVAALEDFVQDRPRIWDSLVYFQCDSIDSADGILKYTLRARHLKTWQDAPQILASRAELLKFCNETSKSMGIHHQQ